MRVHLFVPVALPARRAEHDPREEVMEPIVERCAGIDIGKVTLKATLRVQGGPGPFTRLVRPCQDETDTVRRRGTVV